MKEEIKEKEPTIEEIMKDYHEELERDHTERTEHNTRILAEVGDQYGSAIVDDILAYMEDVANFGKIRITDTPKGDFQNEGEYEHIKGLYVDQYCDGWADDAFYGTVSIPLDEKTYLEIPYTC